MPTEDFAGWERAYARALERLAEAPIADRDHEAIRRYIRDRDGELAVSSLSQYANSLRFLAEYSDTPIVDLTTEQIRDLFFALRRDDQLGRGDGGPSDATLYNYGAALKKFGDYLDADWYDEWSPDKHDDVSVDPSDMLSQEDIAALVDAARRPRNQAVVEFLADTGARVSLMGSLRIRDVDLDGDRATYRANTNARGLKGADPGPYPIIDSKASLRTYLRHSHPRPDEPDAALFHRFEQFDDAVDEDDGALSPTQVRRVLEQLRDRAEIDKPANPHNFRHSAVTRMWREGYDKQEIQHRVQWTLDTNMWERYVHVTAEEMTEEIFDTAGVVDSGDAHSVDRRPCGNCRETVPPHADWCPACGEPLSPDARHERGAAIGDIAQGQADIEDLSRREFRALVLRRLAQLEPDHESLPSTDSRSS